MVHLLETQIQRIPRLCWESNGGFMSVCRLWKINPKGDKLQLQLRAE